ncbi:hypothetical protein FB451DRAFT_1278564, partial [Mycena latifolia]
MPKCTDIEGFARHVKLASHAQHHNAQPRALGHEQHRLPRAVLPGSKKPFLELERRALERWYTAAFALMPLHIAVIAADLLCSNGEGDDAYRLIREAMAVIMERYTA